MGQRTPAAIDAVLQDGSGWEERTTHYLGTCPLCCQQTLKLGKSLQRATRQPQLECIAPYTHCSVPAIYRHFGLRWINPIGEEAFRLQQERPAPEPPARAPLSLPSPTPPPPLNGTCPPTEPHILTTDDPELVRLGRLARLHHAPPKPQPFPVLVLPEPLQEYLHEVARIVHVPVDYAAVALFAVVSTCIGRRVTLALNHHWRERTVFWLAIIGEPGDGKTPAGKPAFDPFEAIHARRNARYDTLRAEHDVAMEEWNGTPRKDRGDRPVPSDPRHLLTHDVTMESLGVILSRNNGVLYHQDEMTSFVASMNAYRSGKGNDREKFLGFWSLNGQQIDRLGRTSLFVRNPHLCLYGGVQPGNLGKLSGEAAVADGFIDRFLWCWPEVSMRPDFDSGRMGEPLLRYVFDLLETLARPDCGGDQMNRFYAAGYHDSEEPDVITLSHTAHCLWRVWYRHNERLRWEHTSPHKQVYAKFPTHAARLSLLLHCLRYPGRPRTDDASVLTLDTLRDGLTLTEYFRSHTNRVLAEFADRDTGPRSDQDRVLGALVDAGGDWLSTREIHRDLSNNVKHITRHLDALARQGRVEATRTPAGQTPGRPAIRWRAIPDYDQNTPPPTTLCIEALMEEAAAEFGRAGEEVPTP